MTKRRPRQNVLDFHVTIMQAEERVSAKVDTLIREKYNITTDQREPYYTRTTKNLR